MESFLKNTISRLICWYLVLVLSGLLVFPGSSYASFIQTENPYLANMDKESIKKLKISLEEKLIIERLAAYGLSREKIISGIQSLTDEERHILVASSKEVQVVGENKDPDTGVEKETITRERKSNVLVKVLKIAGYGVLAVLLAAAVFAGAVLGIFYVMINGQ